MMTAENARAMLAETFTQLDTSDEAIEQIATMLRDQSLAMGLDLADRTQLEAAFTTSLLTLGHLQGSFIQGNGAILCVLHAEALRRLLDGELPILSMAQMVGLEGSINAPPPPHITRRWFG